MRVRHCGLLIFWECVAVMRPKIKVVITDVVNVEVRTSFKVKVKLG